MKTVLLICTILAPLCATAHVPCSVKAVSAEYIKQNYNELTTRILEEGGFIEDESNPEFQISFGVTCWGGCSRPILNPDTLGFQVTRVSDGKSLQSETTSRLHPGSKVWWPTRKQTLKKLFSCEYLRSL